MTKCGSLCTTLAVCAALLSILTLITCILLLRRRYKQRRQDVESHHPQPKPSLTPHDLSRINQRLASTVMPPPRVVLATVEAERVHRYGSDPTSRRVSFTSETKRNSLALSYPHGDISMFASSIDEASAYESHLKHLIVSQFFATVYSEKMAWEENRIAIPENVADAIRVSCGPPRKGDIPQHLIFSQSLRKPLTLHFAKAVPQAKNNTDESMYYADIRIETRSSPATEVYLGLVSRPHPHDVLPGSTSIPDVVSVGYSSDGRLHLNGTSCQYGEPFTTDGSIVRIGYRPKDGYLAFWVNGRSMGMASWGVGLERELWTCIGVRGQCVVQVMDVGVTEVSSKHRRI